MKVKTILSQHRNDFTAMMECEHCGHEVKNPYGYMDANYFENVIPAMVCPNCRKDRAGNEPKIEEKTT